MKFRLRPGLAVAAAISLAILCSLGGWQLKRLAWKTDLIAQTEARLAAAPIPFVEALTRAAAGERMDYQPVYLDGAYANAFEARVFGTYDGAAGVYVFTPLCVADDGVDCVYVNRGFAPQEFRDRALRADGEVEGMTRVEGLFRSAERKRGLEKWLAPKDQPTDNLYFVRDPQVLAARRAIAVPSFYVDAFGGATPAPWPKGGLTRVAFPNRHLEYALTWFGLAAALIGVFIAASVRRD
jgi:surfeit locus 1 family protein